ncbi:MAG: phosphoenolpyruvate--protein phosphotransferase [Caldilineaceae bacterium]|nr:phosphoenolpyruvate--protein phosphotransferase [Caldilineaceae bacterium]
MPKLFRGLPAAPGVGIGNIFIYRNWHLHLTLPVATATDPAAEWQHFLAAQQAVEQELATAAATENPVMAEVFTAQRLILQDQSLLHAIQQTIWQEHQSALAATYAAIHHFAELFRNLSDEYFASRAVDIVDVGQRLFKRLGPPIPEERQPLALPERTLLVAYDITFSELSQLPLSQLVGIALAESTPTAHSAILARSLGIPLVCTLGEGILQLPADHAAVLDGHEGYLLIAPTPTEVESYQAKRQAQAAVQAAATVHAQEPAYTQDGQLIPVLANANNPEEVARACSSGADGIGLLRTEYLFQNRLDPPTLTEQIDTYLHFARQMACRQLTVRALDIGGDKSMPYLIHTQEANPFLGLRGIRLLLAKAALLTTQYRALCHVAAILDTAVELRFMVPMISTVAEVRAVRTLLDEVHATEAERMTALRARGGTPIKFGVMIEVPSAALVAEQLAPLVDFFSIGTNDLAQYTLAADRTNSSVAALADPLHPAVLRLIQQTCHAARHAGIPVSICGEIGGDPAVLPLLLGLGLQEVSVPIPAIPLVKEAVRRSTGAANQILADQALTCEDASAVRALLAH